MCAIRSMCLNRYIWLGLLVIMGSGCARNGQVLSSNSRPGPSPAAVVRPTDWGGHQYGDSEKVRFQIPAEAVSDALRAWNGTVRQPYSMESPRKPEPISQPVDGLYTPPQALCLQLKGTGFTYTFENWVDGVQHYAIGPEGNLFDDDAGRHAAPSLAATCAQKNPGAAS